MAPNGMLRLAVLLLLFILFLKLILVFETGMSRLAVLVFLFFMLLLRPLLLPILVFGIVGLMM